MHHRLDKDLSCSVRARVDSGARERGVRAVVVLTAVMMVVEIAVGYLANSMALLADGWHMATHVGALGLASAAYALSRRFATHRAFAFGTGKIHALAGYTSAVALGLVALLMMGEAASRLLVPAVIDFESSLPVAVLGLVVNLASLRLLHGTGEGGHGHGGHGIRAREDGFGEQNGAVVHVHVHVHVHEDRADGWHRGDGHRGGGEVAGERGDGEHEHEHEHEHRGHLGHGHGDADHNHRAAVLHVAADALTSSLAIVALLAGRYAGYTWLDPAMGIVGGLVILKWGVGLCRHAAFELLDVEPSARLEEDIRSTLEAIDDVRVSDLHVWSIGHGRRACIVTLISSAPRECAHYRERLEPFGLGHLTVEVLRCSDGHEHGHGQLPLASPVG